MKAKILYLMEYPIDLPGGGQMSTQTLCEGIAGTSFTPVVACPELLSKKASDYPFRIVTYRSDENREQDLFRRILNFIRRIFSFYRIIRAQKPDLIHVSMSESLITFGMLRCIGIFSSIPFVYTDRGLAYGYRAHSKRMIRATLKHAACLITTTEYNAALWKKEDLRTPIRAIHNTVASVFEQYDPKKREELRSMHGISEDDFVIGFAGRISEEKDWDFVPELVGMLKEAGLSFKVALVISVYEAGDLQTVSSIKEGICRHIGEKNLLYLQDLSQDEMADYYYLPDVFVMSSMFESFGKAAVEAMSRKCPVLSTNVGGLPEVIGKEENLYSKDRPDRFVLRMKEYMQDPDARRADGETFRERYLQQFTRTVHLSRHEELYSTILEQGSIQ